MEKVAQVGKKKEKLWKLHNWGNYTNSAVAILSHTRIVVQ